MRAQIKSKQSEAAINPKAVLLVVIIVSAFAVVFYDGKRTRPGSNHASPSSTLTGIDESAHPDLREPPTIGPFGRPIDGRSDAVVDPFVKPTGFRGGQEVEDEDTGSDSGSTVPGTTEDRPAPAPLPPIEKDDVDIDPVSIRRAVAVDGNGAAPAWTETELKALNAHATEQGITIRSDELFKDRRVSHHPRRVRVMSGRIELKSDPEIGRQVMHDHYETTLTANAIKSLVDVGSRTIHLELWEGNLGEPVRKTETVEVNIDTYGPLLRSVEYTGDPKQDPTIYLEFNEEGLNEDTVINEAFKVERIELDRFVSAEISSVDLTERTILGREKQVVEIALKPDLAPGVYRVRVHGHSIGGDRNVSPLRDLPGNFVGGRGDSGNSQELTFGVQVEPEPSERVEFPEFLPTLPQPESARQLNPGDRVVTTVVRLFYTRDAHRVAQIVNRNVKSHNRAAVTLAEQNAQNARKQADNLTDTRRANERQAVVDSEDLRHMESLAIDLQQQFTSVEFVVSATKDELDSLKTEIPAIEESIRQLEQQRTAASSALDTAKNDSRTPPSEIARLTSELAIIDENLAREKQRLEDAKQRKTAVQSSHDLASEESTRLSGAIQEARSNVATQRATAQASNERAIESEAQEQRAREEQFRLEVAAAHADPDTYAPGTLETLDPVAQVSISVIGEGLIQLRGPRKGIDAIRTMIHQMDAPVGQVKVEIVTVQVNGERADRMEAPLGKIEAYLGLGNFLTSQSMMILRQCIVEEAARIAMQEQGGHMQRDRDRRYLYAFFGRDFIDELYEMDSEFLFTENKLLGLHSMDTMSLHQALFVLALAKNDVRQNILARFMDRIHSDLIDAEFDFRRSTELFPHKTNWRLPHTDRSRREAIAYEGVALNNMQRYHFTNLLTFFGSADCNQTYLGPDTMNPAQREFLKLAQIFKARLICELELKQRIIERTMIESSREEALDQEERAANVIRPQILELTEEVQQQRLRASEALAIAIGSGESMFIDWSVQTIRMERDTADLQIALTNTIARLNSYSEFWADTQFSNPLEMADFVDRARARFYSKEFVAEFEALAVELSLLVEILSRTPGEMRINDTTVEKLESDLCEALHMVVELLPAAREYASGETTPDTPSILIDHIDDELWTEWTDAIIYSQSKLSNHLPKVVMFWQGRQQEVEEVGDAFRALAAESDIRRFNFQKVSKAYSDFLVVASRFGNTSAIEGLKTFARNIYTASSDLNLEITRLENAQYHLEATRGTIERQKLLDFLIEEQEERLIDLLDGSRSQIAAIDDYLKRLAIALEDDFKIQFFDPAFVHIRDETRSLDVQLGIVERTSILTNNRALAKVSPQATMEFDLPKRNIAIVEALDGAKALAEDYGALLQDPTFLSAYQLMGGGVATGKMQNIVPGLPTSTDEQQMGITNQEHQRPGSALESLIPDPSIYKFETGTGYEIRPVIQPDGNSIIYDFNYMYTTEIREPVRADEKHLGRVRRHFINTQVHTSSFEMRELSRYQVALKASRTSQGVPLLQDIPGIGVMFRPLPSDESSIQQNIILARSVVYPTLFDLMGLRWAPSVVDIDHVGLRDSEHVTRGRYRSVADTVYDLTSRDVDQILGIPYESPEHHRQDLYHRQRYPSPYHPGGHVKSGVRRDASGADYRHPDRRPFQMQQEQPYDDLRRVPLDPAAESYREYQAFPLEGLPFVPPNPSRRVQ